MKSVAQGLEASLLRECDMLRRASRALVNRAHPDVQVTGPRPSGRVEGFVRGVRVDFEGVLWGSGRAVLLEAKTSHASPSWPLADVGDEQLRRMALLARCGALVALYVQHLEGARVMASYLLPVDAAGCIAGLVTHPSMSILCNERKSIRWADMEPWKVSTNETWLDAAERLGLTNKEGA